ncbi:DNA adenine methylase [Actinoplanes sp. NPDC026670]|uniref:DNA adenine methylase n=1 Tax=Actinoplanes sp. NPDC026670 TaxID=3154700 RepID=UPI0033D88E35
MPTQGRFVPQPYPYQGSKHVIAAQIVALLPERVPRLIEPFAGSAAVSLAARTAGRADTVLLNDLNAPLMGLLSDIIDRPEELVAAYRVIWESGLADPGATFLSVREAFNRRPTSPALMYLLRRCVKAAVRYNSEGGFNQSADKRRTGARPAYVSKHVTVASGLLRGVTTLSSVDYKDILAAATARDVIYMDPPYQGTSGNRDQRYVAGLDFGEFVRQLTRLNSRGIAYILSYDGYTGEKTYGRPLPRTLGLHRLDIDAGVSAQATLLGRAARTTEALFVSPALQRVSSQRVHTGLHPGR